MKESTIYEFDPAIYPRKVWVAVTDDTESLKNYFSFDMDEHFAYLVGWAADCMNNIRTGNVQNLKTLSNQK